MYAQVEQFTFSCLFIRRLFIYLSLVCLFMHVHARRAAVFQKQYQEALAKVEGAEERVKREVAKLQVSD
jgi:hypothetical protein